MNNWSATTGAHWDNIFATRKENEVSWFQSYPATSMAFVNEFALAKDARIIDVGGGDSHFAEALIDAGFTGVRVLDISANALARAKKRLGEKADRVRWVVSDISDFEPAEQFDFWHDRAAFHFLTTEEKVSRYVAVASKAIRPGGYLVLGTFSESGPEKCSGLDIRKYNEKSMSTLFEQDFRRIRCFTEDHVTPSNAVQNFQFCSFQKK